MSDSVRPHRRQSTRLPSLVFSRQEQWSGLPFPSPMHESEKWKWSRSVVSDSERPHGLQPTRLLHPWDFPGKSTGVGCHRLLHLTLQAQQKVLRKASFFSYQLGLPHSIPATLNLLFLKWNQACSHLTALCTCFSLSWDAPLQLWACVTLSLHSIHGQWRLLTPSGPPHYPPSSIPTLL